MPKSVQRLLRTGESETVEFKESISREALECLSAFANTKGGTLLMGVDDKGAVVGIRSGQGTLKDVANQIDQSTGLQPSIKSVRIDGKSVLLIHVLESKIKPVMYRGRAYRRVGSTTRQMGVNDLTQLVLDHAGITWDELPESRAGMSDISGAKIKSFIRLANEVGRRPVPSSISIQDLLKKLDLLKKGRLTRAAILLFGKSPQKFYPQAVVKAGRFRSETLIVDDREIEDTLFDQVEGAMQYFRERLQTEFKITGKPQRDVIWEYPLEALREAVTNAVCHRDYTINGHTQIRIYDDRLIVWNPGNLPEELSIETLKKEHASILRNRLIAKVFFYAGLIEQWGSGIVKMIREAEKAGHPEPLFEEMGGFRIIFGAKPDHTPHVTPQDTPHVTPQAEMELSAVEEKVLKFCKQSRTRAEIVKMTGLSDDYVRKDLLPRLIRSGKLSYTLPNLPRSPRQKYIASKT